MFEAFMKLFFDYDIVGDYYDRQKDGCYRKKYIRKWRFKGSRRK